MKAIKITNYVSTGLLSALLLVGGVGYFLNYDFFYASFTSLGYPTYLIYPLAIAKILAIIALWTPNVPKLKEWAYAGLFYDFLLAFSAHVNANHDEYLFPIFGTVVIFISYFSYHKVKSKTE